MASAGATDRVDLELTARSSISIRRPPTARPSRLAAGQGSAIAVGARTLWKRLAAAGLLAMQDDDQNTVQGADR